MVKPTSNKLLNAFPDSVKEELFPQLTLVTLPLGKVLYEAGQKVTSVYRYGKRCIC